MRLALLAAILASLACTSSKATLVASPPLVEAKGLVTFSRTANKDIDLHLRIQRLAPPRQVDPLASTYVAWAVAPGGRAEKLGAVELHDDSRGELDAITGLRRFDLVVTVEVSENATAPGRPLLRASVDARRAKQR